MVESGGRALTSATCAGYIDRNGDGFIEYWELAQAVTEDPRVVESVFAKDPVRPPGRRNKRGVLTMQRE
jgi:hypothetical protein